MKVAVFGATSAMAMAACRKWAESKAEFFLVARQGSRLDEIAADLMTRGGVVKGSVAQDLADPANHEAILRLMERELGVPDVVLVAYGVLPESNDLSLIERAVQVNGTSPIMLIEALKDRLLAEHRKGLILAISSVAGVRGKASNYVYCAAKGLLSRYLEGLRHAMQQKHAPLTIVDVRPGFTDSPMTAGFPKGPLWASAAMVGGGIADLANRWQAGASLPGVKYIPGYWRWIMLAIRHVPDFIFRKMAM